MSTLYNLSFVSALYNLLLSTEQATFFITSYLLVFTVQSIFCECTVQPTFYYPPNKLPFFQGWVIRRRRIIRRIVFITYLTVFSNCSVYYDFGHLTNFAATSPLVSCTLLPLSASVGNFSHASAATTPWGFLPGQLCMLLHLRWDSASW